MDPASISSGWALFRDGEYMRSGTVLVDKAMPIFDRLEEVFYEYHSIFERFNVGGHRIDECYIEQLPRRCHHYTHWSVAVIGLAASLSGAVTASDIPVPSWQKYCDWRGKQAPLRFYKKKVGSEDELAAIGMGLFWVDKHEKEA